MRRGVAGRGWGEVGGREGEGGWRCGGRDEVKKRVGEKSRKKGCSR